MRRTQHIVPSGIVAATSLWVCWISFTQEPADAFLFPRLISVFFVLFAGWTFIKALLGRARVGDGIRLEMFQNLLPGLIVAIIYIYWAANALGFYTATAIAFFILLSLYDPASHLALRSWLKRLVITACFIAVMYGLFALLLKVFTPREIFF